MKKPFEPKRTWPAWCRIKAREGGLKKSARKTAAAKERGRPSSERQAQVLEAFTKHCPNLSNQASDIIRRRFGLMGFEYHTLKETAAALGKDFTCSDIHRLQNKALKTIGL